ncbi:MAG: alpha/beta hydrolase [Candidatus Thiodiazotropha sp.]
MASEQLSSTLKDIMQMQNLIKYLVILLLTVALLTISGCSILNIKQQSDAINNTGTISGSLKVETDNDALAYILLFKVQEIGTELVSKYALQGDGEFRFYAGSGTYAIAAFQDTNRDKLYQHSEPATIYGGAKVSDAIVIQLDSNRAITLEQMVIHSPLEEKTEQDNISFEIQRLKSGELASLDDPKFSREIGTLGLWEPMSFLEQVGGGLYTLSPPDKHRIPVIFIHGAGGTPLEFEHMIESLDSSRFQAWVLHYPSGLRLDIVSDFLVKSINQMDSQLTMKEFYLVAHSMGGLVMRSTVMKYTSSTHRAKIGLAMTINSPMNGMASAEFGTKTSPIVLPSWRDVAKNSDFIKQISEWSWPHTIPYHLVFSYESGSGDDGVVALESQLPMWLQSDATRLYGFNAGHATILVDRIFVDRFKHIINASQ